MWKKKITERSALKTATNQLGFNAAIFIHFNSETYFPLPETTNFLVSSIPDHSRFCYSISVELLRRATKANQTATYGSEAPALQ